MNNEENNINLEQNVQPSEQPMGLSMSRFNNTNIFGIDTTGYKYVDLKTLYETDPQAKHKVLGFFINNKGKFGPEPNAILENKMIANLPRHLLDTVKQLLDDNRYAEYIKDGHVGFSIYQYHSNRYDRDAYSVTWLDLQ